MPRPRGCAGGGRCERSPPPSPCSSPPAAPARPAGRSPSTTTAGPTPPRVSARGHGDHHERRGRDADGDSDAESEADGARMPMETPAVTTRRAATLRGRPAAAASARQGRVCWPVVSGVGAIPQCHDGERPGGCAMCPWSTPGSPRPRPQRYGEGSGSGDGPFTQWKPARRSNSTDLGPLRSPLPWQAVGSAS